MPGSSEVGRQYLGSGGRLNQRGEDMKKSDSRCCGSGVCIINDAGECWCGQKWDGEKMVHMPLNLDEPQDEAMQIKLESKNDRA